MNNPMYFELQADDPERLIKFYENVFRWKFEKQPIPQTEYWSITTEGIRGGLLKRPAKRPPPMSGTNAAVISMEVENFDETGKTIGNNKGIIALPKFSIPGRCWQGYFVDPDGNTFGIFEVDLKAR